MIEIAMQRHKQQRKCWMRTCTTWILALAMVGYQIAFLFEYTYDHSKKVDIERQYQAAQLVPPSASFAVGGCTPTKEQATSSITPRPLPPALDQSAVGRLEFVHIPKTGGTAIEIAAARANVEWGVCRFQRHFGTGIDNALILCPNFSSRNDNDDSTLRGGAGRRRRKKGPTRFPLPYKQRHVDMASRWHFPSHYYKDSDENNPYTNATLFAVVRNPYDKVTSEYYMAWQVNKKELNYTFINNATQMNDWLYKFLTLVKKDSVIVRFEENDERSGKNNTTAFRGPGYYVRDGHFLPQYDYMYDSHDQPVVHHVLHFETLETDFGALMKQYNLSHIISLPSSNNTYKQQQQQGENDAMGRFVRAARGKNLGVENLTQANIELVNTIYQKDFEIFGYTMKTNW
jgi:Sulfotransferase family